MYLRKARDFQQRMRRILPQRYPAGRPTTETIQLSRWNCGPRKGPLEVMKDKKLRDTGS